jgi:hypothetical protein
MVVQSALCDITETLSAATIPLAPRAGVLGIAAAAFLEDDPVRPAGSGGVAGLERFLAIPSMTRRHQRPWMLVADAV